MPRSGITGSLAALGALLVSVSGAVSGAEGPATQGGGEPFCGVEPAPRPAPSPDLHCVELLARYEVRGASGWGEMLPVTSGFGLALDREGVVRWRLAVRVSDLPAPAVLDPEARAWIAWATGPNLVPEIRLGEVTSGSGPGADPGLVAAAEVALDKFRVLVTAERDPGTPIRTGPVGLRGDSPSMRMLPHDEPWLFLPPAPGGDGHGDHAGLADPRAAPGGPPPPLRWRMPPMHPMVPMPPGLEHLAPAVTPWLPGADLTDAERSALPVAQPTRVVHLRDGDSLELVSGPVRRMLRGHEHVLFGFNGQIPGPRLVAPRGATIQVRSVNTLPFSTAIHWHGIRLANRFDGVPGVTQDPIPAGASFDYTVTLPDAGTFWYHPHIREDATQGLGLSGNLQVTAASTTASASPANDASKGPSGPAPAEVFWILDDLLVHDDGTLVPFGLEAPTHALMGRFGNVPLVNGEERPVLEVDRGQVLRFHLTNVAAARPYHLVFGAPQGDAGAGAAPPRVKLVAGDLSPFETEAWVEGVVIAPAERYAVEVRFDAPGLIAVENRVRAVDGFYGNIFPDVDTVAFVRVRDTPAPPPPPGARPFDTLHEDAGVRAEIESLRPHLQREPDLELVLAMEVGELPFPLRPLMQMDSAYFSPVEWVSTMPEMNWPLTPREVRWILRDGATGRENGDIDWRFREGDLVRLRVRNEREVLHAMQHPIHVHGQRFLVLSLNGVPLENLAWKDTFMLPVGWTAELLVEMSNPGDWMIHCHISEHLEAGMQTVFRVEPAEGTWEGWRGFEPGRGGTHGGSHEGGHGRTHGGTPGGAHGEQAGGPEGGPEGARRNGKGGESLGLQEVRPADTLSRPEPTSLLPEPVS
jgi:suppressor of ftsI